MRIIKQIVKIIIINLIILFSLTSNVFASNYTFNGETIPETSGIDDNYYGVDTIVNILDNLAISYDENTKVSYTYYINQALKALQESMSSINLYNIIFVKDINGILYIRATNGGFNNELTYLAVHKNVGLDENTSLASFNKWGESDGIITGMMWFSSVAYTYKITSSSASKASGTIYYRPTGTVNTQSTVFLNNIVSPIQTYSFAGVTAEHGYGWYMNSNVIEFTKSNGGSGSESGDTGGSGSGDTSTSGDYGGVLDNISGGISDINNNLENLENTIASGNQEILNNMLNSGDLGIVLGDVNLSGDEWVEEESDGFIGSILKGIYGVFNKIWRLLFEVDNEKVTKLINNFNEVLEANSNMLALPLYLITSTMNTFIEYEEEDFIISWNAINYQNVDVIPAGSINFNQIVNNNEKFKEIYDIAITVESVAMIFLFASWLRNMFLDLLGINWLGHQSEEPQDRDITIENNIINTETGEYKRTKTFEHREGKTGNIIRTIYKGGK